MSEQELRELLQKTARMGGPQKKTQGPVKVKPLTPEYKQGQFAQQWTRLDEPVQPFKSPDINQTDMFAVIEAGHSQYKGLLRSLPLQGYNLLHLQGAWRNVANSC